MGCPAFQALQGFKTTERLSPIWIAALLEPVLSKAEGVVRDDVLKVFN